MAKLILVAILATLVGGFVGGGIGYELNDQYTQKVRDNLTDTVFGAYQQLDSLQRAYDAKCPLPGTSGINPSALNPTVIEPSP